MSRIHFCAKNTSFCPFKQTGAQMLKNPPKQPLPLWACEPPSNTRMSRPTPLTMPNDSTIGSPVPHNYATKSPLVTIWYAPNSPAELPLPFRRSSPPSIHPFLHSTDPTLDPFSRLPQCRPTFRTDRQTDRPTHRPTDGLGARSVP